MDYCIGHLTLRPHRELTDGDRRVVIARKALDLLSVLAQADNKVVTKDELMAAVWPGVIVEENAIQVHMVALRRALGQAADNLSTVRGVGYQLIATALTDDPVRPAAAVASSSQPVLAVLTFENQSPNADLCFFAEGISEEILLGLARIDGIRVIARTSSFQLNGGARRPDAVRAELGATHILDGSVRRDGERVRIAAQLVDCANATILWSNRFEGEVTDVFALQDSIAEAVASALRGRFEPPVRKPPVDVRALDLYLQGRQQAGPEETRRQCIASYKAALQIDSHFADAWASLALAQANSARWDRDAAPFAQLEREVRQAAAKALELDPCAASAQVALGLLEPFANYAHRESYLKAAMAARPADAEVLRQYTDFTFSVGRISDGCCYVEQAWRNDPLNPLILENYASVLYERRDKQRAFATYAFGRAKWPEVWWFHFEPLLIAAFAGEWPVVDDLLAEQRPDYPELALARFVADALRKPDDAKRQQALAAAEARQSASGRADPSNLIFLVALGLTEEAFSLIDRSTYDYLFKADGRGRDGIGFQPGIIFSMAARPLRDDPRFVRLCGKLGLCRYWADTGRWPDCADEAADRYDFRAATLRWLAENRASAA